MFGRNQSPVRTRLCWEGGAYLAVVLAVLSGALVREINLLFMVAGLMAGPLLWSWWWGARMLRAITVRRRLPQAVCAGDLLVVDLEVANSRARGGSWALVAEELLQHETGSPPCRPPRMYMPFIPAGGRQTVSYRGRLVQRGRYQLGPVRLSTRFPFGLFRHTTEVGPTEFLIVYPRTGRLTRRWSSRHQEAFEGAQRSEQRSGRAEGDFYGVRPWRSSDSRRWIHWRASARHQTLVVRQFEQYRNRDLVVVLELWQSPEPHAWEQENVELAVSFAATIITQMCRKGGNRVGLAIAGQETVWLMGPASTGLLEDAVQHLALAQATSEDHLPELLERVVEPLEPGTEVMVIQTRSAPPEDPAGLWELRTQMSRRSAGRPMFFFDINSPTLAEYFVPE